MNTFYILKDRTPVSANAVEWMAWKSDNEKVIVQQDYILANAEALFVSTVFVGLYGEFFETMVFKNDKPLLQFSDTYSTWDNALEGHLSTLREIRKKWPY